MKQWLCLSIGRVACNHPYPHSGAKWLSTARPLAYFNFPFVKRPHAGLSGAGLPSCSARSKRARRLWATDRYRVGHRKLHDSHAPGLVKRRGSSNHLLVPHEPQMITETEILQAGILVVDVRGATATEKAKAKAKAKAQ